MKLHELWLSGNGDQSTPLPSTSATRDGEPTNSSSSSSSSSSSLRSKAGVYSFDWFAKATASAAVATTKDVTSTTTSNNTTKPCYLQWDQRIVSAIGPGNCEHQGQGLGQGLGQRRGQGLGRGPFEDALHQAVISTLAYALTQMTTPSSPGIVEMAKSYREDVGLVKRWLLSASSSLSSAPIHTNESSSSAKSSNNDDEGVLPLRCYLSSSSGNSSSNSGTTASSSPSSSSSLLSSRWITAVSAFTRTLATWGRLLTMDARVYDEHFC